MGYNIDKHSNKISGHDRRKCSYYNQIDMQNEQRANVLNRKSGSAQEDDEYYNI